MSGGFHPDRQQTLLPSALDHVFLVLQHKLAEGRILFSKASEVVPHAAADVDEQHLIGGSARQLVVDRKEIRSVPLRLAGAIAVRPGVSMDAKEARGLIGAHGEGYRRTDPDM